MLPAPTSTIEPIALQQLRRHLQVTATGLGASVGRLMAGSNIYPCLFGHGGLTTMKREGDRKTPVGRWPLRCVYYRPDRLAPPSTRLPLARLERTMGWCDDAGHQRYNSLISLPFPASAEQLWRTDHVYDLIVILGYNDRPAQPGKGSALFIHLASEDLAPTAGCLALSEKDLLAILTVCGPGTHIHIG